MPVASERPAHGVERGGFAQPQRREPLAQVGEVNLALVVVEGFHAKQPSTLRPSAPCSRVTPQEWRFCKIKPLADQAGA